MRKMKTVEAKAYAYNFIDGKYLPKGKDEYYLRNEQAEKKDYRSLTYNEVEALIKNGNSCTNWDDVLVEDPFNPALLKNNIFAGLVRIGKMENSYLQYHDFIVPIGITNSRIISSDILGDCAIHDCAYISHYIIGERVILSRIDELCTTNHSKFGEGIVKDGEEEAVRVAIDVLNETGGREVLPFSEIIPADAYLWARFREDKKLIAYLKKMTQSTADTRCGFYGVIGSECCIKSCRIIKDVNFGEAVYVKGANKLKNLTIKSTFEEQSQIGEGVELVNGIIGLGSRIFYGVKAVRFVTGSNCEVKYGARLIHSILGDNSTISCCEVLNALIFPFHEQHHNNSFLIAALVRGQSNIAAGATIGSNHNTRGNDGELVAGRGFWPGLCTTFKHNSKFASFVLVSKANYNYELNIKFPFSLVINNEHDGQLEIMPAYYWMHNMYSLERNNKKFLKRDRRVKKVQIIETDYLAPDTACEIMEAMQILENKIVEAWKAETKEELTIREILTQHLDKAKTLKIYCEERVFERSKRRVRLLKPAESWLAYRQMLVWYGIKTLTAYFAGTEKSTETDKTSETENNKKAVKISKTKKTLADFKNLKTENVSLVWENLGGQLINDERLSVLRKNIGAGKYKTWKEIHNAYYEFHTYYEDDKAENAYIALLTATGEKTISEECFKSLVKEACEICDYIAEQIFATKNKDYTDKFREITYRNKAEHKAVISPLQKNEIVSGAKTEADERKKFLKRFL